jgi:hypothetical protein
MKSRNGLVWVVWGLVVTALVISSWLDWIDVPTWIRFVFGFALLVFGLVWWAVSSEKLQLGQR